MKRKSMDRREFVKTTALGGAALAGIKTKTAGSAAASPDPHAGIQIYCHNLLDEGIDRTLDRLRELGQIDTLYLTTHTYYCAVNRPPPVLANHGIPIRDERERRFPKIWLRSDDSFYRDTILRHQANPRDFEYGDRDLFEEIQKPLRSRGMKLFARWYEPSDLNRVLVDGKPSIANWEKVLVVDMNGKPGKAPCWNHPDYREWLRASVLDMFSHYELDGMQYGAERVGPLSEQLFRQGFTPTCFCRHCVAANQARGFDVERARTGYRQLSGLMDEVQRDILPADGIITTILRIFQKYPEVLGWNYQWLQADVEIHKIIYDAVKSVNPAAEVARHVDHQRSSWDILFRAAVPYSDMEGSCDWIKPILYHRVFGPRLHHWKLAEEHKTLTRELTLEQSLDLFYSLFHYDAKIFPALDQLDEGIPPEYVYVETRRAVEATGGRVPVASGIGIDIPWNNEPYPSKPESVYRAVQLAFQAGARGVVASREYDEMQLANIKAFGDAVRDFARG